MKFNRDDLKIKNRQPGHLARLPVRKKKWKINSFPDFSPGFF
ncbi:MAG: hypothetical protein PWR20_601 [Bacteroidales bacterium]|jgi:hypothetical protein|nr:hypothetical protein [Bacteroidales bacterium]MDN5328855.1 hypothetical protein [Bacteroidales bacterium]